MSQVPHRLFKKTINLKQIYRRFDKLNKVIKIRLQCVHKMQTLTMLNPVLTKLDLMKRNLQPDFLQLIFFPSLVSLIVQMKNTNIACTLYQDVFKFN